MVNKMIKETIGTAIVLWGKGNANVVYDKNVEEILEAFPDCKEIRKVSFENNLILVWKTNKVH